MFTTDNFLPEGTPGATGLYFFTPFGGLSLASKSSYAFCPNLPLLDRLILVDLSFVDFQISPSTSEDLLYYGRQLLALE